jgi:hypothetical protein
MQTVSRINTAQLGCMGFVTLTYHNNWQGRDVKRDLDSYIKRIRRYFPEVAYLWRLEPQRRGAPHFHVLLFFPQRQSKLSDVEEKKLSDSWHFVVDQGNIHHAKHGAKVIIFEDGYQGVQIYTTKYCAKLDGDGCKKLNGVGKYWGRSRNLPLDPIDEVVLSDSQDAEVRRYCRRFLKGRKNASARRYANTVVQGHIKARVRTRLPSKWPSSKLKEDVRFGLDYKNWQDFVDVSILGLDRRNSLYPYCRLYIPNRRNAPSPKYHLIQV